MQFSEYLSFRVSLGNAPLHYLLSPGSERQGSVAVTLGDILLGRSDPFVPRGTAGWPPITLAPYTFNFQLTLPPHGESPYASAQR